MIEELCKVIRSDERFVWLEVQPKAGCGSCSSQSGCGVFSLSRYFSPKPPLLRIQKPFEVLDQEELILEVEEAVFLKGAFFLYSVPLLGMFLGAIFGAQWIDHQDWLSILLGLVGLVAGFAWVFLKGKDLQFNRLFQPTVRRKQC